MAKVERLLGGIAGGQAGGGTWRMPCYRRGGNTQYLPRARPHRPSPAGLPAWQHLHLGWQVCINFCGRFEPRSYAGSAWRAGLGNLPQGAEKAGETSAKPTGSPPSLLRHFGKARASFLPQPWGLPMRKSREPAPGLYDRSYRRALAIFSIQPEPQGKPSLAKPSPYPMFQRIGSLILAS